MSPLEIIKIITVNNINNLKDFTPIKNALKRKIQCVFSYLIYVFNFKSNNLSTRKRFRIADSFRK
jgi:hypothetical protein